MKKKPVVFFNKANNNQGDCFKRQGNYLKDKAIILKTRRIFHKIYTFTLKTR